MRNSRPGEITRIQHISTNWIFTPKFNQVRRCGTFVADYSRVWWMWRSLISDFRTLFSVAGRSTNYERSDLINNLLFSHFIRSMMVNLHQDLIVSYHIAFMQRWRYDFYIHHHTTPHNITGVDLIQRPLKRLCGADSEPLHVHVWLL